eukprot:608166-Pyramimonas_sp.AAC.2
MAVWSCGGLRSVCQWLARQSAVDAVWRWPGCRAADVRTSSPPGRQRRGHGAATQSTAAPYG